MLRRSLPRCVHLFSALVPAPSLAELHPISQEQWATAKSAVQERSAVLSGSDDLLAALQVLTTQPTPPQRRSATRELGDLLDRYRGELYKKSATNAEARMQIHETIMALGYYQRLLNTSELKGECIRFVLNHYSFDVRRDTFITRQVHDSLREENTTTAASDKLLTDLLLLERRLYGRYRFVPTAGRQWFVLGMPFTDIKTEAELHRLLALPPVVADGNFVTDVESESDPMWKTLRVQPGEESTPSFMELAALHSEVSAKETYFALRAPKPPPPLAFWDRVKESLLKYWVIALTVWLTFWAVDEEIITLVALIVLKWKQTSILQEEAEKTGGKVYIASSTGKLNR